MNERADIIAQIRADRDARTKGSTARLENYGFKVYSQSDEDGIIHEIFRRIGTTNKVFVEFGAEVGLETNCRLLLEEGWSGLWIEGNPEYAGSLRWTFRNELASGQLKFTSAYVDRDNINALIAESGITGAIDFLSVDIDSNDYHVFDAISVISPRVLCIEHCAERGPEAEWIMDYDPGFRRVGGQHTGASITSMTKLANLKGYELVGCGLYSPNGFYVQRDLAKASFEGPFTPAALFNPKVYDKIVSFPAGRNLFG